MADPYSGVSISGYNSNPPADDGSAVEANRVKWSTIKTKLNDPVKTRTDDINTALIAAFAKVLGGAGITSTSISYTVLSTDQGKLVRATASGITITTPDATDVDAPFVFCLLNDSTGDITFDGSGSQTIDGDANVTVPAGAGLTVFTDGSNWLTTGQNFKRTLVKPQCYLTLLSLATSPTSPMPTSDQSGKTAVYLRPDGGNLLPIPDGTNISVREFSELTLTLNNPNHVASTLYDVYVFSNSGTLTIGTGPAWTTNTPGSCARGTGAGSAELDTLKGLPVNKVSMTARNGGTTYSVGAKCGILVGTIFIDSAAGQVTCHVSYGQSRKWGVWNVWNRRPILLKAGDSTATWTYNTDTIRAANGSSSNSLTIFTGLPDEWFDLATTAYRGGSMDTNEVVEGVVGIGYNSTSAFSGRVGQVKVVNSNASQMQHNASLTASHLAAPALGINTITALERGGPDTHDATVVWNGAETYMVLSAKWRG